MNFLKKYAKVGYAQHCSQVISLVQQVVVKKNLDVEVTHGRRHKDLTLRTAKPLAYIHMVSSLAAILDTCSYVI